MCRPRGHADQFSKNSGRQFRGCPLSLSPHSAGAVHSTGDQPDMAEGLRIVAQIGTACRIDLLREQTQCPGPFAKRVIQFQSFVEPSLVGEIIREPEVAEQEGSLIPQQAVKGDSLRSYRYRSPPPAASPFRIASTVEIIRGWSACTARRSGSARTLASRPPPSRCCVRQRRCGSQASRIACRMAAGFAIPAAPLRCTHRAGTTAREPAHRRASSIDMHNPGFLQTHRAGAARWRRSPSERAENGGSLRARRRTVQAAACVPPHRRRSSADRSATSSNAQARKAQASRASPIRRRAYTAKAASRIQA